MHWAAVHWRDSTAAWNTPSHPFEAWGFKASPILSFIWTEGGHPHGSSESVSPGDVPIQVPALNSSLARSKEVTQPIQATLEGELSANCSACSWCWENSPAGMHIPTTYYQHFCKKLWTQWSGIFWEQQYSLENSHPPQNPTATVITLHSYWDRLVEPRRGDAEADECFSLCPKAGFVTSTPTRIWETTWLQGQNFFSALGSCTFASWTCNANHK